MAMHGGLLARPELREASISAVITRADGSVEDLGTLTYWHRNPLRRLAWRAAQLVKGARRG
jgi:hypothetical protein